QASRQIPESHVSHDALAFSWLCAGGIQRKIQFENVDARIAENAEIAPIGVLLNQFANLLLRQSTSFGDARSLQLRVAQADLRIEAAAGRGHSVSRHGFVCI